MVELMRRILTSFTFVSWEIVALLIDLMKRKLVLLRMVLMAGIGLGMGFLQRQPAVRSNHLIRQSPAGTNVFGFSTFLSTWRLSGQQRAYLAEFKRRIDFYGQVLDENEKPIAGATIYLSPLDNPLWSDATDGGKYKDSQYWVESDSQGCFYLTGMHGAEVYVRAEKEGYYRTKDSNSSFREQRSEIRRLMPTKDKPAIFHLRKKGEGAALIYVEHAAFRTGKDWKPTYFSLSTGERTSADKGDIQIELWANKVEKYQHYDWKCRISVPRGGLVERKDVFDFMAPEIGYQPFIEIYRSPVKDWSTDARLEFFAKTGERYARFKLWIITRGGGSCILEDSYLNPSGSRYLEPNESKVTKIETSLLAQ